MRALFGPLVLMVMTALAAGCASGSSNQTVAQAADKVKVPGQSLQIKDITVGTGASPALGKKCVVHYTGWLYENGVKGQKFDSSVDRGEPFEFLIGQSKVIPGWDQGVASMKVGGKRTLIIPPHLAYGPSGSGDLIPPNSTLLFEIELIDIRG